MGSSLFADAFYTKRLFLESDEIRGYANVASSGTISFEERPKPSFFARLGSFFSFKQNNDLAALDTKLCQIFAALRSPDSPEFQALKSEARQHKFNGYLRLEVNLGRIYKKMEKNNEKSWWQKTALSLVNVIRRCFGWEKLAFTHYKFADFTRGELYLLQKSVRKSAFKPTEKEIADLPYKLEVLSGPRMIYHLNHELDAKSVSKMQLGFHENFKYFVLGINDFSLSYLLPQKVFTLEMLVANHGEDNALLEKATESFTKSYSVDVKIVSDDPSKSEVIKLETKKVVKVQKGWFKDTKSFEDERSKAYPLPFDREIHIPVHCEKEPFRFILRSNKPAAETQIDARKAVRSKKTK